MKGVKELLVRLEGVDAGRLTQDANGRVAFEYEAGYRSSRSTTPLSLSMPKVGHRYEHATVFPFLAGLLPDNDAVVERWGRLFGVRAANVFGLLAAVGEDCAGAVQFVRPDRIRAVDDEDVEWLTEDDVGAMLRDLRTDPYTWQQPGVSRGGHFSLAGAQVKFALLFEGGRWGRPSGRIPTTHIVKPGIDGVLDHEVNEHLCLGLAARLGLPAAASEIHRFGDERAVVVRRYDRRRGGATWSRVHQEDMCQALSVPPTDKYQRDGGPSPRSIVDLLRSVVLPDSTSAVDQFVRSLALNWFIAGTDAHAKNYGLLLHGPDVRLAPLYDVASALVHPEYNWHKWELAMRVGKEGRLKYLTLRHWETEAATLRVPWTRVRDLIVDLADRVPDALSDEVAVADGAGWDSDLPHRLLDAVTAHIARLRRENGF